MDDSEEKNSASLDVIQKVKKGESVQVASLDGLDVSVVSIEKLKANLVINGKALSIAPDDTLSSIHSVDIDLSMAQDYTLAYTMSCEDRNGDETDQSCDRFFVVLEFYKRGDSSPIAQAAILSANSENELTVVKADINGDENAIDLIGKIDELSKLPAKIQIEVASNDCGSIKAKIAAARNQIKNLEASIPLWDELHKDAAKTSQDMKKQAGFLLKAVNSLATFAQKFEGSDRLSDDSIVLAKIASVQNAFKAKETQRLTISDFEKLVQVTFKTYQDLDDAIYERFSALKQKATLGTSQENLTKGLYQIEVNKKEIAKDLEKAYTTAAQACEADDTVVAP